MASPSPASDTDVEMSLAEAAPAVHVPSLVGRLLEALEAPDAERQIREELLPLLARPVLPAPAHSWPMRSDDLVALVKECADQIVTLRNLYIPAVGKFCLEVLRLICRPMPVSRDTSLAVLKLLEGVLLVCMTDAADMPNLCEVVSALTRHRIVQRLWRMEFGLFCMGDAATRSLYAPEALPPAPNAEARELELKDFAASLRPSPQAEAKLMEAFKEVDSVIWNCFKVHGQLFGSSVNGFQLTLSDLDICVKLPESTLSNLLESLDSQGDWCRKADSKRRLGAACAAAARQLASYLTTSGFPVSNVVEHARVPIVKFCHKDLLVDIAFSNEVAIFNSRLLRAYADFDPRAVALVRLVKHWAKQRLLNSAIDGTLSSYSYSLLAIHYLQIRGILPNLQAPPRAVLHALGLDVPGRHILEAGHDVWFANPEEVQKLTDLPKAQLWLGSEPPEVGIYDLLYGFFRYFVIDFHMYSEVASIRLRQLRLRKMQYFREQQTSAERPEYPDSEQEGSEVAEDNSSDEQVLVNGVPVAVEESAKTSAGLDLSQLRTGEAAALAAMLEEAPLAANAAGRHPPAVGAPAASPGAAGEAVSSRSKAGRGLFVGTVRRFNAQHGYGFIECKATLARHGRDVYLHSKYAAGLQIGDRVAFTVILNPSGHPQARNVRKAFQEDEDACKAAQSDSEVEDLPHPASRRPSPPTNMPVCLSIDDPMERNRVLSTTYAGQEAITVELLRAMAILRKGGLGSIEELFEAKDTRARPFLREFPLPPRPRADGDELDWEEVRKVGEDEVGAIIGVKGATIGKIKEDSGVSLANIKQSHDHTCQVLHLRGTVAAMQRALELVEQAIAQKFTRRKAAAAANGVQGAEAGWEQGQGQTALAQLPLQAPEVEARATARPPEVAPELPPPPPPEKASSLRFVIARFGFDPNAELSTAPPPEDPPPPSPPQSTASPWREGSELSVGGAAGLALPPAKKSNKIGARQRFQ